MLYHDKDSVIQCVVLWLGLEKSVASNLPTSQAPLTDSQHMYPLPQHSQSQSQSSLLRALQTDYLYIITLLTRKFPQSQSVRSLVPITMSPILSRKNIKSSKELKKKYCSSSFTTCKSFTLIYYECIFLSKESIRSRRQVTP